MKDCKEIFEIILLFHLDREQDYDKERMDNPLEDIKDRIEIYSGYKDQLSTRGNLIAYLSIQNINI